MKPRLCVTCPRKPPRYILAKLKCCTSLVQVANLGQPHRKQLVSRQSGRQRFAHTLRMSTSKMEWWTCQRIWGMTILQASSARDHCVLEDWLSIPCTIIMGVYNRVHSVHCVPELRAWARGQSSGKTNAWVAVKDCGGKGYTSEGPGWPERHQSGCK